MSLKESIDELCAYYSKSAEEKRSKKGERPEFYITSTSLDDSGTLTMEIESFLGLPPVTVTLDAATLYEIEPIHLRILWHFIVEELLTNPPLARLGFTDGSIDESLTVFREREATTEITGRLHPPEIEPPRPGERMGVFGPFPDAPDDTS
jgi:hypothetical protein